MKAAQAMEAFEKTAKTYPNDILSERELIEIAQGAAQKEEFE